jgi:hypothetical protein
MSADDFLDVRISADWLKTKCTAKVYYKGSSRFWQVFSMWGRKGLIVVGFFGLLLMGAFTLAFWAYTRDPLLSLPPPEHGLKAERAAFSVQDQRHVEHITLHGNTLGDITFTFSLPDPLPPQKLPVVLVLGGLVTGENSIRDIKDAGDNAIVGYAWPIPIRLHDISVFLQALGLYHRLMAIPGQVASVLYWLINQPWADAERISRWAFPREPWPRLPCRVGV